MNGEALQILRDIVHELCAEGSLFASSRKGRLEQPIGQAGNMLDCLGEFMS